MPGLRGILHREALAGFIVIAAATALVLATSTRWIGFLGYTLEWANAGLYIGSPLIAGVAAFLSRHHFAPEVIAITGARRLRGAAKVISSAWTRVIALAISGHVAAATIGVVVTLMFGASGDLTWEPLVYAVLPISMACAIGIAVSAIIPHVWASALAVVATYGLWYVCVVNDAVVPVDIGGATVSLAGLDYRLDALLISLLVAAVVTAAFLGVGLLALRRNEFGSSLAVFSAVAMCVVVGGSMFAGSAGESRFRTGASPEWECEGMAPTVCLTSDHSARLSETAAAIERVGGLLAEAGVDLTGIRIREALSEGRAGGDGILMLDVAQLNGIGVEDPDYAHALLTPTACAVYFAAQPAAELQSLSDAAYLVGGWLEQKIEGARTTLSHAQVRELYEGLRECDVDERLLRGLGG